MTATQIRAACLAFVQQHNLAYAAIAASDDSADTVEVCLPFMREHVEYEFVQYEIRRDGLLAAIRCAKDRARIVALLAQDCLRERLAAQWCRAMHEAVAALTMAAEFIGEMPATIEVLCAGIDGIGGGSGRGIARVIATIKRVEFYAQCMLNRDLSGAPAREDGPNVEELAAELREGIFVTAPQE